MNTAINEYNLENGIQQAIDCMDEVFDHRIIEKLSKPINRS